MSLFIGGIKDNGRIEDFEDLDNDTQHLIETAIKARNRMYRSGLLYGSAASVRTADGSIYTACNVEDEEVEANLCVERTAAEKALNDGQKEFIACATVAQIADFTTPCRSCKYFMSKHSTHHFPIYATRPTRLPRRVLCTKINTRLPCMFNMNMVSKHLDLPAAYYREQRTPKTRRKTI